MTSCMQSIWNTEIWLYSVRTRTAIIEMKRWFDWYFWEVVYSLWWNFDSITSSNLVQIFYWKCKKIILGMIETLWKKDSKWFCSILKVLWMAQITLLKSNNLKSSILKFNSRLMMNQYHRINWLKLVKRLLTTLLNLITLIFITPSLEVLINIRPLELIWVPLSMEVCTHIKWHQHLLLWKGKYLEFSKRDWVGKLQMELWLQEDPLAILWRFKLLDIMLFHKLSRKVSESFLHWR